MSKDLQLEGWLRTVADRISPSAEFVVGVRQRIERQRRLRIGSGVAVAVATVISLLLTMGGLLGPADRENSASPAESKSPPPDRAQLWPRQDAALGPSDEASIRAAWTRLTGDEADAVTALASGVLDLDSDPVTVYLLGLEDGSGPHIATYVGGLGQGALFGQDEIGDVGELPHAVAANVRWRGRAYALVFTADAVELEASPGTTYWEPVPATAGLAILPAKAKSWRASLLSAVVSGAVDEDADFTGNHGCALVDIKRLPKGERAGDPSTRQVAGDLVYVFGEAPNEVSEVVGRNALGELDPLPAGHEQVVSRNQWMAQIVPVGDPGQIAIVASGGPCDYTFWLPLGLTIPQARDYAYQLLAGP